jgi:O-antigen ligase
MYSLDRHSQSLSYKHLLLVVVTIEALCLIPVFMGEFAIALMIPIGLLVIGALFFKAENALILLPLILQFPVEIPGSGIQVSEAGTLLVIFSLFLSLFITRDDLNLDIPMIAPLVLILIAYCLSLVNATYLTSSVKNIIKYIQAFLIVYVLTVNLIRQKQTILAIFVVFMLAGALSSVIGIWRYLQGYETRVFGLLGGGFGAWIGLSTLIAINALILGKSFVLRVVASLVLPVLLAGLILSQTRAWMLGLILAVLFTIVSIGGFRRALMFLVIFTVLAVLVYGALFGGLIPTQSDLITTGAEKALETGFGEGETQGKFVSILMRVFIWIHGFNIYMNYPIFGFGIGNMRFKSFFTGELGAPDDPFVGYVDNHWLMVLYETGILGIVAWLWLAVLIFRGCRGLMLRTRAMNDSEWHLIALSLAGAMIIFLCGSMFWALTVVLEMTVLIAFLVALIFGSNLILDRMTNKSPALGESNV